MAATGSRARGGRGSVSGEVREVLLGTTPDRKACRHCGGAAPVGDWPVEVTVDGDRVAYVGRCPACDGLDNHYVVDALRG